MYRKHPWEQPVSLSSSLPGQAQPHDPGGGPAGIVVAVVSVAVWGQQLVLWGLTQTRLLHHADLQGPQLDRAGRRAGLQGAHCLAVAPVGEILPVDTQEHITWWRSMGGEGGGGGRGGQTQKTIVILSMEGLWMANPLRANDPLTSFDPAVPGQGAVELDAGHKDGQLAALAAPPPRHSHPQGLLRLFLHSDVFLLTGDTLGQILHTHTQVHTHTHTHTEKDKIHVGSAKTGTSIIALYFMTL